MAGHRCDRHAPRDAGAGAAGAQTGSSATRMLGTCSCSGAAAATWSRSSGMTAWASRSTPSVSGVAASCGHRPSGDGRSDVRRDRRPAGRRGTGRWGGGDHPGPSRLHAGGHRLAPSAAKMAADRGWMRLRPTDSPGSNRVTAAPGSVVCYRPWMPVPMLFPTTSLPSRRRWSPRRSGLWRQKAEVATARAQLSDNQVLVAHLKLQTLEAQAHDLRAALRALATAARSAGTAVGGGGSLGHRGRTRCRDDGGKGQFRGDLPP